MNAFFFWRCIKTNKVIPGCFFLFLLGRVAEVFSLTAESLNGRSAEESLAAVNSIAAASFVFVPLFCVYIARSVKIVLTDNVILLHGARESIIFRFLLLALFQAFLYSATIIITSLPLIIINSPLTTKLIPVVALTLALQTLFFTICALAFFLAFSATRMTSMAYIAVVVYGLWDFMASFIVGGGLPFLGWTCTAVTSPILPADVVHNLSLLAAILGILFVACLVLVKKIDFLTKRVI